MTKKEYITSEDKVMTKKGKIILLLLVGVIILAVAGIFVYSMSKKEIENPVSGKEETKEVDKEESVEETVEETVDETVDEPAEEEKAQDSFDESTMVNAWATSNVNLREQADGNSAVITVLPKGTEVKKGTEENGWVQVKYGEVIGYVSAQYLSETKPEEQAVTETPTNKIEVIPGQYRDPNNVVVVIDPGHQLRGESTKEPNGPGSSVMKARVTSGTTGVATRVPEYVMNLEVSLKLRTELENRGYTVYMTRSTHEVSISNKERAEYAATVNADIAVRIHGNGSSDASVRGAETYAPSANNPYVSHLSKASISLSQCIVDAYCQATGFKNRGVFVNDTMTGMNWSTVPVTILELGYMSNAEEDKLMQDATMQNNMVQGIANGIDAYFGF